MRISLIVTTALCSALLSGCASMFGIGQSSPACPGGQGIGCVSARDAYAMSNNAAAVEAEEAKAAGKDSHHSSLDPLPVSSIQVSLPEPVAQPMPVMEPAKIMRLWINTWQDDQQVLHFPNIVFVEVTPRRWAVGNTSTTSQAKVLVPYRIESNPNTTATLVTSGPGHGKPTPAQVTSQASPAVTTSATSALPTQ